MKKQKNDNLIVLKLALFIIAAGLYFCGIWFLNRAVYPNALFFRPKGAMIAAFANGAILIFCAFFIGKKSIEWIKGRKRKAIPLLGAALCWLMLPLLFLKSGTVADGESIRKINAFGAVTEEYRYEEISRIEIFAKHGIEYEITFSGGEALWLASHEVFRLNSFGGEKKMVEFDRRISAYAEKEVYASIYSTPENLRQYLKDDAAYRYFEEIFRSQNGGS